MRTFWTIWSEEIWQYPVGFDRVVGKTEMWIDVHPAALAEAGPDF